MKYITIILCLLGVFPLYAQQPTLVTTEIDRQQYTIMVVPYISSKEIIKDKIENDTGYRLLITRIGEAIAKKGYPVQDYVQAQKNCNIPEGAITEASILTRLIECSPPDVYITVEMIYKSLNKNAPILDAIGRPTTTPKTENEVILNIRAIETFSSEILAQMVISSGGFYTNDWDKLVNRIFIDLGSGTTKIDAFCTDFDKKYTDILRKLGRSVGIKCKRLEDSGHTYDDKTVDGSTIGEAIYQLARKNPKSGKYCRYGGGSKDIIFFTVRIPLVDEEGRSYTVFDFWIDYRPKIESLKLANGELVPFEGNNLLGPRIQINLK